jgi:hypothetical protein
VTEDGAILGAVGVATAFAGAAAPGALTDVAPRRAPDRNLAVTLVTGPAAGAVVAAEASGSIAIDFLDTVLPVPTPVPLIAMVCVPGLPESTIVSVALKAPGLFGVK